MKDAGRSTGLGAALIILLTVLTYLPALRAGFIWDDDDHLTRNPAMLSGVGLKQIWSSLAVSRYYPLTLTSFWVQRRLWGLDPLPYHAVNVALQAVNAMLLWMLLRRLQVHGAWVAAAVWAVHPVNVETVAWVTELKNTQSGLFFLLALLMFLRFEDRLRPRDYVIAVACGVAAMLSKPSTVVLPCVMLLCAWWRRGLWTRKDLLRVAPLVTFAVGMSLLTIVEQRHQIESGRTPEWTLTAAQRLLLAGHAVWFYAGKLLWPTDVCFLYPRWELRPDSIAGWLPISALGVVAGLLWHFRRDGWARPATFGLGCFIVALLPVLGFFDIYFFRYSFVADHFQYLASIGLIGAVVSAGAAIFQRAGPRCRVVETLAAAAVLCVLGVSTWRQAYVYYSLETLWRDTVAKNPNAWLAHNNLGSSLAQAGKLEEAVRHFEQTLRIKPDYATAHYNLGSALVRLGSVLEGIEHWEQAVRIKPDYAEAHHNLGGTYALLNRLPEAISHFEEALRVEPDYAETHYNLGSALARSGRVTEAIGHWEQALRLKPDYAEAHYDLGVALVGLGRLPEAMGHWEQALRIRPDYAEAHCNLAVALERAGKLADAARHYRQALQVKPDFAEAQRGLARVRVAE